MRQQLRAAMDDFLRDTPNAVLATMPTALNRKIINENLSCYFRRGDPDTVFAFAGDLPYSIDLQRQMLEHIGERNAVVREVAQTRGIRLIDLAAIFNTEPLADFREDFHDLLHLRPRAYPKAAAAVYRAIKDLL